jgi:pantetheine-phosphate adenylyltransferase
VIASFGAGSLESAQRLTTRRGQLKKVTAIYPGSFDPPTNGHLDLIERGSKIFDELVVAILRNPEKESLFTLAERRKMLQALTSGYGNVRVDTFDGLLVDYAVKQKAQAVLRGIRAISDYEYELQMALMNRKLEPRLETVFMMPAEAYSYLSSRLVKEIARLGGSIRGLIPDLVEQRLLEKMRQSPINMHLAPHPGGEEMNGGGKRRGRASAWQQERRNEAGRALGTSSRRGEFAVTGKRGKL